MSEPHSAVSDATATGYDPMFSMPAQFDDVGMQTQTKPSTSVNGGGVRGVEEGDKDPFLSLLEQLAENEQSRGGPSELDFFLSGGQDIG